MDINRGDVEQAHHGKSPLDNAFALRKQKRARDAQLQVEPKQFLGPGQEDDCVGFLFPYGSKLWKDCHPTFSYFCVSGNDIGLRSSDEGAHRPVLAHFRLRDQHNKRQRSAAAQLARKQRGSKRRKKQKKASSAGPSSNSGPTTTEDPAQGTSDIGPGEEADFGSPSARSDSEPFDEPEPWAWLKGEAASAARSASHKLCESSSIPFHQQRVGFGRPDRIA